MRRQEKAEPCPPLRDHCSETTTPYHSLTHRSETTAVSPPPPTTALPYHSETTAVETTTLTTALSLLFTDHRREPSAPYHSLVPDDRHPLLRAVGALRDQGEVVLSDSLLGRVEGTVSAAGHLEISTTRNTQHQLFTDLYLRSSLNIFFSRVRPLKVFKTVILPPGDRKFRRRGLTLKLQ